MMLYVLGTFFFFSFLFFFLFLFFYLSFLFFSSLLRLAMFIRSFVRSFVRRSNSCVLLKAGNEYNTLADWQATKEVIYIREGKVLYEVVADVLVQLTNKPHAIEINR